MNWGVANDCPWWLYSGANSPVFQGYNDTHLDLDIVPEMKSCFLKSYYGTGKLGCRDDRTKIFRANMASTREVLFDGYGVNLQWKGRHPKKGRVGT